MTYAQIKSLIANPNGRPFYSRTYAINNGMSITAIVYANNEQDALDEAVDAGKLDAERMSNDDYAEYESKGWDDSYVLLGNASEPFWSIYLGCIDITGRKLQSQI